MVVCKFYQQGKCKFGNNCRFEHNSYDYPKENRGFGSNFQQPQTSYFQHQQPQQQQHQQHQQHQQPQRYFPNQTFAPPSQRNVFGQQQPQDYQLQNRFHPLTNSQSSAYTAQTQALKEYVKVVSEDSKCWENGNQWPFSCYAPLLRKLIQPALANPNSENLPSFNDFSADELRWAALQSQKSGNTSQYIASVQQLAQEYRTKCRALQNMDPQTSDFIIRYESGEHITPSGLAFATTSAFPSFTAPSSTANNFSFKLPAERSQPLQNSTPMSMISGSSGNSSNFTFALPTNQTNNQQAVAPIMNQQMNQFVAAPALNQTNITFSNPLQAQQPTSAASEDNGGVYYSQHTPQDLEQFKADKFTMGQIPFQAPPRELCF